MRTKTSQQAVATLLSLSLAIPFVGCDDDDGSQVIIYAGAPAGGMMTGGELGGENVAGTPMAGIEMGGTPMAGIEMGGTPMAGIEMGGTPMAGIEMGGTPMAGIEMGGVEVPPIDCTGATLEAPCSALIYQARQEGMIPNLTPVTLTGVITAIRINTDGNASHIVLQDPRSGAYSGIWIYLNDHSTNALPIFTRGDEVTISGIVDDYYGQRQMNDVFFIQINAQGLTVSPMVVSASDVSDTGPDAPAMEGVLVTVQSVTVQSIDPPADPNDSAPINEFTVNGGLRIDDFLVPYALPMVGDAFTGITGILRYGFNNYKLVPRDQSDLAR